MIPLGLLWAEAALEQRRLARPRRQHVAPHNERMVGMVTGLVLGGAIVGAALRPLWAIAAAGLAAVVDAMFLQSL